MKTGLIFGKFAPLTKGHQAFILNAVGQIDKLYLFLSYDDKFVNSQPEWIRSKLQLADRLRDLKDLIRDQNLEEKVIVQYVDESNIPGYPEGGAAYAMLIREKIPQNVVLTHAFSSEPDYDEYFHEFFPEVEHVVIDANRGEVPISATMIRNDLHENFKYLTSYARKRFVRKVAIIGVESTGKTTMAQHLARYYLTCWTPEIGRKICEEEFHSSEFLMNREDYLNIAMQHRLAEDLAVTWAMESVVFSDTTNLITHFSAICAGKVSYNDNMFMSLAIEEAHNFYDMVLFLSPEVPWVADPLRLQDTEGKRENTNTLLWDMVHDFYQAVPVIHITGTDYQDRINQAIKAIDKLLAEG